MSNVAWTLKKYFVIKDSENQQITFVKQNASSKCMLNYTFIIVSSNIATYINDDKKHWTSVLYRYLDKYYRYWMNQLKYMCRYCNSYIILVLLTMYMLRPLIKTSIISK